MTTLRVKIDPETNEVLQYPYHRAHLQQDNPLTTFPVDELIDWNSAGVFDVLTKAPPPVAWYESVAENNPALIDGQWQQQWVVINRSPEDVDQRKKALIAAIEQRIDQRLLDFVATRGYSSVDSVGKYKDISDAEIAELPAELHSTVVKFRTECRYAAAIAAATWAKCYALLAQVDAGNWPTNGAGQMPSSYEDIAGELPALAWPV